MLGFLPPFALGSEGGHIPTFWLLLWWFRVFENDRVLTILVSEPLGAAVTAFEFEPV